MVVPWMINIINNIKIMRRPRWMTFKVLIAWICAIYFYLAVLLYSKLQQEVDKTKYSGTNKINYTETYVQNKSCSFLSALTQNYKFLEVLRNVLYVYSAYLDERYSSPMIRIMGLLSKKESENITVQCIFKHQNVTEIKNAKIYEMCENHKKEFGGYIFSCVPPKFLHETCKVSVSAKLQNIQAKPKTVTLGIIKIKQNDTDQRSKFGVCVPPLFGNVSKNSITEFIEFNRILGAEYFIFYDYNITDREVYKVLNYYICKKMAVLIPWKLPALKSASKWINSLKDILWYHGQLIAHNDCLYRSMTVIKKLAIIDTDEFIIPHGYKFTWEETLDPLFKSNIVALSFDSAFYNPIPLKLSESKLITIDSLMRSQKISKIRTKVMVQPEHIFEVGIHHVSKPVMENFIVQKVDHNQVLLHHYRTCLNNHGMKCLPAILDFTVWKYLEKLKHNVDDVMQIKHKNTNCYDQR